MKSKVKIICENAINYDSMEDAKLMIKRAKEITERTGVKTFSKFQMFNEDNIINPEHKEYCLERLLSPESVEELFKYGKSIGQEVFFTPMYSKAVKILEDIGVNYYKIRYYDKSNEKLIKAIRETEKTFFITTDNINRFKNDNCNVFECIAKYPAHPMDYNLGLKYDGISDHTKDLEMFNNHKGWFNYWEKHVMLEGFEGLENEWSITFKELEAVL